MTKNQIIPALADVESVIRLIRGHRVILDADAAALYGVETKTLNRAVKRNLERFPPDFMFQLTPEDFTALRYQSGTSNGTVGRGGRRYLPYAFTEHGVAMTYRHRRHRRFRGRTGRAALLQASQRSARTRRTMAGHSRHTLPSTARR